MTAMKESIREDLAHTALLMVDVQDAFLNLMDDASEILGRCLFAIQTAFLFGMPVAVTEQVPDKLGRSTASILNAAAKGRFFPKASFSGLHAEGMMEYLREKQVKRLLVAGLETPVCVFQTVMDALDKGFEVTVLTDCIGSRRLRDAPVVHTYLHNQTKACLLPSETVFYQMLGHAGHELFRDFNKLVKKYG